MGGRERVFENASFLPKSEAEAEEAEEADEGEIDETGLEPKDHVIQLAPKSPSLKSGTKKGTHKP